MLTQSVVGTEIICNRNEEKTKWVKRSAAEAGKKNKKIEQQNPKNNTRFICQYNRYNHPSIRCVDAFTHEFISFMANNWKINFSLLYLIAYESLLPSHNWLEEVKIKIQRTLNGDVITQIHVGTFLFSHEIVYLVRLNMNNLQFAPFIFNLCCSMNFQSTY